MLALREAGTPLHELVWSYAPSRAPAPRTLADVAVEDAPSRHALSKRLKRAGFRFVGPTTVYAAMQACGVVNDHLADCWVRDDVERERAAARPHDSFRPVPESRRSASAGRGPRRRRPRTVRYIAQTAERRWSGLERFTKYGQWRC